MGTRGRKSSAELTTASFTQVAPVSASSRLQCPVHLSDAIRAVWAELVNDQPASAFTVKDVPLLEQYCRHVVLSRVLANELEQFDSAWLADDEGLKRYDRLLSAHEREGRAASSLATRLRITRQSMADAKTVGRANARELRAPKPWELGGDQ